MLSANAQPFDAALEGVSTRLQQFSGLVNGIKAGSLGGITQALGNVAGLNLSRPLEAVGNLASHLPGELGSVLGALGPLAPVIKEAVNAFLSLADSGRQSFKELDRIRKMYGLQGAAAAGLRLAVTNAGMSMEEAAGPLGRLQRALGQAGAGSAEAQRNFRQMGLDGLALSRLPLEQSLARVAQRFREIKDPNERAAAAARIFGRNWQDSMKLLDRMADQEKFQRIAGNFGAIATARDMALFQRHKESTRELSTNAAAAQQGIGQQAFASAAPAMTFLSDLGSRALEILGPVFNGIGMLIRASFLPLNVVIALIEGAAEALKPVWVEITGALADFQPLILEIFGAGEGGLLDLVKNIAYWAIRLQPTFWILRGVVWVIARLVEGVIAGINAARGLASTLTGGLISAGGSGGAGGVSAEQVAHVSELRTQILEQAEALRRQREALGGSSVEMRILEARSRGLNDAITAGQRAFTDAFLAQQGYSAAFRQAVMERATATEQLRQANAEFQSAQTILQLQDQAQQLLSTADAWQRYRLAREGASEGDLAAVERLQFRNAVIQTILRNQQNTQGPGAGLQAGTREALSAVQAYQRAGERRDMQEQVRDAIIEVRDTERANNEVLQRIRDALQANPETRSRGPVQAFLDQVFGPQRAS